MSIQCRISYNYSSSTISVFETRKMRASIITVCLVVLLSVIGQSRGGYYPQTTTVPPPTPTPTPTAPPPTTQLPPCQTTPSIGSIGPIGPSPVSIPPPGEQTSGEEKCQPTPSCVPPSAEGQQRGGLPPCVTRPVRPTTSTGIPGPSG